MFFKAFILMSTLFFSPLLFCRIDLEEIPRLSEDLFRAYLALESGLLKFLRFNGNYGPEDEKFLCHTQLHGEQRNRDCPKDYTSAILQQVFPSPAHIELVTSNAKSDFFNNLTIPSIKKIIDAYEQDNNFNIAVFSNFNGKKRNTISGNNKKFEEFSKILDILFLESKKEQDMYPHIVKYILLGLALTKATTIEELAVFYEKEEGKKYLSKEPYHHFLYEDFIQKNPDLLSLNFKNLLSRDTRLASYYLFSFLKSSDYVPLISDFAQARYKDRLFTACGENSLRNFFNIIAIDSSLKTVNSEYLKNAIPEIINFYQIYEAHENRDAKRVEADNFWTEIIANREGVLYLKDGCFELRPGMDNMLRLIGVLLKDEQLKEKSTNTFHRAKKVKTMLEMLSRENFKLSTNRDRLEDNDVFEILINEKPMFIWAFLPEHFSLKSFHTEKLKNQLNFLFETSLEENYKSLFATVFGQFNVMNIDKEEDIKKLKTIFSFSPYIAHQKIFPEEGELLYGLSKKNHPEIMDLLLKKSTIDVNKLHYTGATALHFAAHAGHALIVRALLDAKADPNIKDARGDTALHKAASQAHVEVVQALRNSETIDPNLCNIYQQTALHVALNNDALQVIEALVEFNIINPNILNNHRETVIENAIQKNNIDMVNAFLKMDTINLNISVKNGLPLLYFAVGRANAEIVEALLKSNKISKDSRVYRGETILHYIARCGNDAMLHSLLQWDKFDINEQNKDGKTALHIAVEYNKYSIVDYIFKNTVASLDVQDKNKETVFDIALRKENEKIMLAVLKELIKNEQIDLNASDLYGDFLLIKTLSSNHEVAKELIKCKRVDINKKDDFSRTALHIAVEKDLIHIVKELLQNERIDLTIKWRGRTAKELAVFKKKTDIINLFDEIIKMKNL